MKKLVLARGVAGAGKTTIAKEFASEDAAFFGEDDYFGRGEEYQYEPDHEEYAFYECLSQVEEALEEGTEEVWVHGVFSKEWQIEILSSLCEKHGYRFYSLVVEKRHDASSVHNVPLGDREEMAEGIRASLSLL